MSQAGLAKTNAERQQAFRDRQPPEVRGIFAPQDMHDKIKAQAANMLKRKPVDKPKA